MKIEILFFEGCPHHESAERVLRGVLHELGIRLQITRVAVPDNDTAARLKFPGSPTIRVDGEDVVPQETDNSYSVRCRLYKTVSGMSGMPDEDAIRGAIQRRMT